MAILACLSCLSCVVLVILNIVGIIVALAITAVGGILLWGAPLLQQIIGTKLPAGLPSVDINQSFIDALAYLKVAGIVIFIFGIALFAICVIGCCATCCKLKILLVIYTVIVGVIFLAFFIFSIILLTNNGAVLEPVKKFILDNIRDNFTSFDKMNAFTLIMSFLHNFLNCCGVNNGDDFVNAKNWNKTYSYKSGGITKTVELKYPETCCKLNNFVPIDYNCTTHPTVSNSNYNNGCFDKITQFINDNLRGPTVGICSGFITCLAILTGLAVIMTISVFESKSKIMPI